MADERAEPRLSAILAADIVGYSRLMEDAGLGGHGLASETIDARRP